MIQTNNSEKLYLIIPLFFVVLLSLKGCDDTLNPFKENDRFIYSLYGYLDSSAERQWIRVINLQDETDINKTLFDGRITLENVETGEVSVLKDSLFQYSEELYAHNFWTEQNIQPQNSYRIRAERSDGAVSSVTVHIPGTFKDPVYYPPTSPGDPGRLVINGIDNLADASINLKVRFNVAGFTTNMSIPVISDTIATAGGYYIPIQTDQIALATRGLETAVIFDCELYIARAGDDWVDFPSIDRNLIALPEGISNVESGTGYVVGVTSKSIPYPNGSCME